MFGYNAKVALLREFRVIFSDEIQIGFHGFGKFANACLGPAKPFALMKERRRITTSWVGAGLAQPYGRKKLVGKWRKKFTAGDEGWFDAFCFAAYI